MEGLVTPDASRPDFAVVGGGIVGLSTAVAVLQNEPRARVVVLEKEEEVAGHQSSRNSGVIHSGVYYKPGSLKARLALQGSREMVEYCREHDLPYRRCEKVIVAVDEGELAALDEIERRGRANAVELERISGQDLRRLEPNIAGIAALHVPSAGITDYREVSRAFARELVQAGGELALGTRVEDVRVKQGSVRITTSRGPIEAGYLVNCAGLHCDRIARRIGVDPGIQIVPFRGEYYDFTPARRSLVQRLIYPVPDPAFPFLGVHLTPSVDGGLHAGPNAVLALAREGYRKRDIDLRDALESLTYPGLWRLAARHWRAGFEEVVRSASRTLFARSLQRLAPSVRPRDLIPAPAGVRAQAMDREGQLVDDFVILPGERSLHVCNAPSPAATASIPIGRTIAETVLGASASARAGNQAEISLEGTSP